MNYLLAAYNISDLFTTNHLLHTFICTAIFFMLDFISWLFTVTWWLVLTSDILTSLLTISFWLLIAAYQYRVVDLTTAKLSLAVFFL